MVTKTHVGSLLVVLLALSIYIQMPEQVKLHVDVYKSTFSVWEDEKWVVSGKEYSRLFDGSTLAYADSREVINSTQGNYVNLTRIIHYKERSIIASILKLLGLNPTVVGDKHSPIQIANYVFDGNLNDKEKFPIEATFTLINATGMIFEYTARELLYTGESRIATSPESFGHSMKVEWEGDPYIHKIYKYKWKDEAKLTLRYRIKSDYEVYKIRLSDPDSTAPTWSNQGQNASLIEVEESVLLYSYWEDETALDTAWLSTNESGAWLNYTDNSQIFYITTDYLDRDLFNITFTANQNSTIYLTIPKGMNATSGGLNLSGFDNQTVELKANGATAGWQTTINNLTQAVTFASNETISKITYYSQSTTPRNMTVEIRKAEYTIPNGTLIASSSKLVSSTGWIEWDMYAKVENIQYDIIIHSDGGSYLYNGQSGGIMSRCGYYDGQWYMNSANCWRMKVHSNSTTQNLYIDVGESLGVNEWNYTNEFNETSGTQEINLNETLINDYLSTCSPDSDNNCNLPILIHTDRAGIVEVSGIVASTNLTNSINLTWSWTEYPLYGNTPLSWKMYANDTSGNINVTDINTFTFGNTSCREINSSNSPYTLDFNLTSIGTCFTIGDNNVIINLAGYTINHTTGDGIGTNAGISSTGYSNVTIRNGTIINGNTSNSANSKAIYFSGTTSSLIENINFTIEGNNAYGLDFQSGSNSNTIENAYTTRPTGNNAKDIRFTSSNNNNFTTGNLIDYSFQSSTGNNFTDMNTTTDMTTSSTAKSYYFTDTSSDISYRNSSDNSIWLKTESLTSARSIYRTSVSSWLDYNITWNDTLLTSNVNYTLYGLKSNSEYEVYNASATGSDNPYTLTTNSIGTLPEFTIYIVWGGGSFADTDEISVIDSQSPIITIQSPLNQTYNDTTSIWFNVTTNEEANWCGYSLDSDTNVTMTNNTGNWNNLNSSMSYEQHNVIFYCNDTVGNMNQSETLYFNLNYHNGTVSRNSGINSFIVNATSNDGEFAPKNQTSTLSFWNVSNTGNYSIFVNVSVNSSLPSCMTTWIGTSWVSPLNTSVYYNITTANTTIATVSSGGNEGLWSITDYDNCTVGTTFNRKFYIDLWY